MITPIIIGIGGGTGSGKTTAAKFLAGKFKPGEVTIISFDDYYRVQKGTTLSERKKTNYDHPDSLEHELLARQLQEMKAGKAIEKPVYDFATHSRKKQTVKVRPTRVIMVEGILALHYPALRKLYDLKLFVEAPADIRFIRRLKRDTKERGRSIDSVMEQYLATVRPMHEQFVEPSKKHADQVILGTDGWGELEMAVKLLKKLR